MIAGSGPSGRRARLAISFADLALLLLGFFVLLQASGGRREDMLKGIGSQFGAKPVPAAPEMRAAELFQPGEALLSEAGKARVLAASRPFMDSVDTIEIASIGQDATAGRFDEWDLAAARLGAVARALVSAGVDERRIVLRGPDQAAGDGTGQRIRMVARGHASAVK